LSFYLSSNKKLFNYIKNTERLIGRIIRMDETKAFR
jgi:hypothetical protein